jgi:hypothetical protein
MIKVQDLEPHKMKKFKNLLKKSFLFIWIFSGFLYPLAEGNNSFPFPDWSAKPLYRFFDSPDYFNFDFLTKSQELLPLEQSLDHLKFQESEEPLQNNSFLIPRESESPSAEPTEWTNLLILWNEWRHQINALSLQYPKKFFLSNIDFDDLEKDWIFLQNALESLNAEHKVLQPIIEKMQNYLNSQNIEWDEDEAQAFDEEMLISEKDLEKRKNIITRYSQYNIENSDVTDEESHPTNNDIKNDFLFLKSFFKTQQALSEKAAEILQPLERFLHHGSNKVKTFNQLISFCSEHGCSIKNPQSSVEEMQQAQKMTRSFFEQNPQFLDDEFFREKSKNLLEKTGITQTKPITLNWEDRKRISPPAPQVLEEAPNSLSYSAESLPETKQDLQPQI